jgi:uncharacterized protein YlxW (UPF0749 family)
VADHRSAQEPADPPATGEPVTVHRAAHAPVPLSSSWRTISRALAPRATRAQLTAGLLCALVGFALVVQVHQNRSEGLASLPQSELVRILDDVTQRSEDLERQAASLRSQKADLVTGSDTQRAAREAAAERAEIQGIVAGLLPAEGPGLVLTIHDPDHAVPALQLYNVLEELRNAGAEAVQVGPVRMAASTYVVDTADGVEVDGVELRAPYRWLVIGDPKVIEPALSIPGGAIAQLRHYGGSVELQALDLVQVTAVREPEEPRFATPVPATETG